MESLFSINKLATVWLLLWLSFSFTSSDSRRDLCFFECEAHPSDGNVTIKWDLVSWTPDGYVAVVTIYNFQKHRQIRPPGWKLGWTWAKKEVIWSMMGAQTTDQGDCSQFKGFTPHSCEKSPRVVDLLHGTPFNQQIANCCKGGVLGSNSASAFQLSVGDSGTTNKTVHVPRDFVFIAPGQAYVCGSARIVRPTRFISADKRRVTQALMTWNVTCLFRKATRMMLQELLT